MNNNACGTCNTNSQIKFENTMLNSSLCDYSDAHILGNYNNDQKTSSCRYKRNKAVIFKNCSQFTECISKMNNSYPDNAKTIDVLI